MPRDRRGAAERARRRSRPAGGVPARPLLPAPPPATADARGERLQKFLAQAGLASRRRCEALIREGRVQVNGAVVRELGRRVDPGRDMVEVDGEAVRPERRTTLMLHKPAGYITSLADPEGRPVVTTLLPQTGLPRLFPVGRLDWDTEGLLLFTNDGELANLLTHPRHGIRKVYHAKLKGLPDPAALGQLLRGVQCEGERLRASAVELMHRTRQNAWVALSIEEGRYRQVRRMCAAIGHPVLKLTRVALGPLRLGALPRGQWRPLSPEELRSLESLRPQRP